MQRAGFTAKGFFVMDGSRRSAHSNAFFTGFGASKRVVFFDTLLQQLSPAEMEAVLAHELGHFKHKHIVKMMATSFAMTLAGLALLVADLPNEAVQLVDGQTRARIDRLTLHCTTGCQHVRWPLPVIIGRSGIKSEVV